jgi:homeobox protein SIX3/6
MPLSVTINSRFLNPSSLWPRNESMYPLDTAVMSVDNRELRVICSRMQQQSGQGNGNARRTLSPGPGASSSEDSDISLGGTSPPSPSSSPPPNHQPSPVPLGSLGPLPPPSLNFRFDPTQPHFRFGHTTAFKFPPTSFRFGPHSPQPNHPNMPGGGIFRFAESSPFQAVGPRGDPTTR